MIKRILVCALALQSATSEIGDIVSTTSAFPNWKLQPYTSKGFGNQWEIKQEHTYSLVVVNVDAKNDINAGRLAKPIWIHKGQTDCIRQQKCHVPPVNKKHDPLIAEISKFNEEKRKQGEQ